MNIQKKEQFIAEFEYLSENLQEEVIDFIQFLKSKKNNSFWHKLSMENFFEDESDDDKLYDNYSINKDKV